MATVDLVEDRRMKLAASTINLSREDRAEEDDEELQPFAETYLEALRLGAEEFSNVGGAEARRQLGLTATQPFPHMAERIGTNHDLHSYSDMHGRLFLETEGDPVKENTDVVFLDHQIIAALFAIDRAMAGRPIMIFDEVGVGKTIEALLVFATLAWYRQYFEDHGEFPGAFRKWDCCLQVWC